MTAFALNESDVLPVSAHQGIAASSTRGAVAWSPPRSCGACFRDVGLEASTVFFGDTKNLPYGKRKQAEVAALSDAIIGRLSGACPVIGHG